jgi:hypothetical protein
VSHATARVIRYTKPKKEGALQSFLDFKARVKARPHTLFLMIADECHWGAISKKPHDVMINDPELNAAENVIVLLVSATPYCLLTLDSRLPEK